MTQKYEFVVSKTGEGKIHIVYRWERSDYQVCHHMTVCGYRANDRPKVWRIVARPEKDIDICGRCYSQQRLFPTTNAHLLDQPVNKYPLDQPITPFRKEKRMSKLSIMVERYESLVAGAVKAKQDIVGELQSTKLDSLSLDHVVPSNRPLHHGNSRNDGRAWRTNAIRDYINNKFPNKQFRYDLISKHFGISQGAVSGSLHRLVEDGVVRRLGGGVYEIVRKSGRVESNLTLQDHVIDFIESCHGPVTVEKIIKSVKFGSRVSAHTSLSTLFRKGLINRVKTGVYASKKYVNNYKTPTKKISKRPYNAIQPSVLAAVNRMGECSISDIQGVTGYSAASVSGALAKLAMDRKIGRVGRGYYRNIDQVQQVGVPVGVSA